MAEKSWYDEDAYGADSFLDSKRGVVREAAFVRHNCGGHCGETTALRFRVELPDVADDKQPYPTDIPAGRQSWPSEDRKTKDQIGRHLLAGDTGKFRKTSVIFEWVKALYAAGFPKERFAKDGVYALIGADITFRGVDKHYKIDGKEFDKAYDFPSEFHGFVEGDGSKGEAASSPETPDDDEALADLDVALRAALEEQGGSIPRGQLSIRLNKHLKGKTTKGRVMELIVDDAVLGQLDGISFDKKTVSLSS